MQAEINNVSLDHISTFADLTTTGSDAKSFEDFVYIGLRMDPRTRIWTWTDGTVFDYQKWAEHQPDEAETEHCGQVRQLVIYCT